MGKTASGLSAKALKASPSTPRRNLPALPEPGAAVSATDVEKIEKRLAASVAFVEDIPEALDWLDGAKALEAYLRSRDLQRPMLGAERRLEARIGELLEPESKGGRGKKLSPIAESLDKHLRSQFQLLAKAGSQFSEEEWRKTRRALVALARQKLGLVPEVPDLPAGQFRCIVADPPWTLDTGPDTWGGTGEPGHDALEYPQMTVPEIEALEVGASSADDAHLYLWTTNRYVESAYSVARAWGFKPSVLLVWAKKPHGVGLGDTFRLTTEFVLFARRGSLDHQDIVPTTWFDWPRSRHSVKPAGFYKMVEKVTPGPRLEMFARTPRGGWEVWGDEV